MKIRILAVVLLLAGCVGDGEEEERRQETMDTMNYEMSLEERVALCDGYGYDPSLAFFVWESRWKSIFELEPPDRETFDRWIEQDVCIDSEFGGLDA